jgi:hypothetical protein
MNVWGQSSCRTESLPLTRPPSREQIAEEELQQRARDRRSRRLASQLSMANRLLVALTDMNLRP